MSKILVAEDSESQRVLISDLLASSNYAVLTAKDGNEALERIKQTYPDVVILDIIMPKINGYEVCRRLKKDPETKDIIVIFCSSKGTQPDHYWGLKQGADAYIAKPFQPQEMIKTIQQLSILKRKNCT